jgi:hypothetical protein
MTAGRKVLNVMIKWVKWNSASRFNWIVTFSTPFSDCHHCVDWPLNKIMLVKTNNKLDIHCKCAKILPVVCRVDNVLDSMTERVLSVRLRWLSRITPKTFFSIFQIIYNTVSFLYIVIRIIYNWYIDTLRPPCITTVTEIDMSNLL